MNIQVTLTHAVYALAVATMCLTGWVVYDTLNSPTLGCLDDLHQMILSGEETASKHRECMSLASH